MQLMYIHNATKKILIKCKEKKNFGMRLFIDQKSLTTDCVIQCLERFKRSTG